MSCPHERRLTALLCALALPMVGGCASLIGLEDADTDPTSTSAGSTSTGTGATTTADATSSSTGAGGSGGGSSVTTSSESSSGVGGGAGGASPTPGEVSLLTGWDGHRLVAGNRDQGEVYVSADRVDSGPDLPACSEVPFATLTRRAAALRFAPTETCSVPFVLESDGTGMIAPDIGFAPPDANKGPYVSLAGKFGLGTIKLGASDVVDGAAAGGLFALSVELGGSPTVAHVARVPSAELTGAKPELAQGFPLGAASVALAGTFSKSSNVTCAAAESGGALDFAGFRGFWNGDACDPALESFDGILLGIAGGNYAGLEYYGQGTGLFVKPVDGTSSPKKMLDVAALDDLGESAAYRVRFVPVPQIAPDVESYYITSGTAGASVCGSPPTRNSPFVAFVRRPAGGGNLVCSAVRLEDDPGYTRVVVGIGTDSVAVVATGRQDDTADLVEIAATAEPVVTRRRPFCSGCVVNDIALSGDDVWILAFAESTTTIVGSDVQPPTGRSFLYRARYDDLFVGF